MLLFLSHAGVDSEAALKVWIDKRNLVPGEHWQDQLAEAIEKQSTAFALYVGSTGVMNWVENEVRLGLILSH